MDTNCEIVLCKLNIIGCRTLYIGSFYRPPDKIDNDYLEEFNSSLSRIMSNRNMFPRAILMDFSKKSK